MSKYKKLDWEEFKQLVSDNSISGTDIECYLADVQGVSYIHLFVQTESRIYYTTIIDGDDGHAEALSDYVPEASEFQPPA